MNLFRYCVCAIAGSALLAGEPISSQENAIKFNLLPIESNELPAATASALNRKLASALDRSQASTANAYNVFAVRPEVSVTDAAETEGMIREVARVAAEMTLSAFNTIDGTVYHSVTVPLKGTATGGKDAAMKAMANSMKPTDPVYVRFVRTARNRINDYYAENCALIIEQARKLVTLQRYEEAANYLSGIPASVACHDQACVLLEEIAPYLNQVPDTVVVERVVEVPVEHIVEIPAEPDTVVVEKVVERPVIIERPSVPVIPHSPASPSAPRPKITIDGTELDFKVTGCTGDLSRGRITITARITNTDVRNSKPYVYFGNAITDSGTELTDLIIKERNYRSGNISMPDGVPVTLTFEISGVREQYASLSYVEISVRSIKVSIRGLDIKWH